MIFSLLKLIHEHYVELIETIMLNGSFRILCVIYTLNFTHGTNIKQISPSRNTYLLHSIYSYLITMKTQCNRWMANKTIDTDNLSRHISQSDAINVFFVAADFSPLQQSELFFFFVVKMAIGCANNHVIVGI